VIEHGDQRDPAEDGLPLSVDSSSVMLVLLIGAVLTRAALSGQFRGQQLAH
jgi:hypothetical protein